MNVTLFAILLVGFTELGFAKTPASALAQLRSGIPHAAESSFSAEQRAFESGQITEYDLLDSCKIFYGEDSDITIGLDKWVSTYPKSSPAHLARGVYYRKRVETRQSDGMRWIDFSHIKGDIALPMRQNAPDRVAMPMAFSAIAARHEVDEALQLSNLP